MEAVGCDGAFTNKKIKGFVWHGHDEKTRGGKENRSYKYFIEHYGRKELRGIKASAQLKNLCAYIRPSMLKFLKGLSEHKNLAGSTLIYSFWSGYKKRDDVAELLAFCESAGMKIETLHISGHASNKEIERLITELQPHTVVPIHCEDRSAFDEISANYNFLSDNEVWEVV
jgi:hypothetical protein